MFERIICAEVRAGVLTKKKKTSCRNIVTWFDMKYLLSQVLSNGSLPGEINCCKAIGKRFAKQYNFVGIRALRNDEGFFLGNEILLPRIRLSGVAAI